MRMVLVLCAALMVGCTNRPAAPDRDRGGDSVTPATTRASDPTFEPDGYPNTLAEALAMLEDRPAWEQREELVLTRHPYEQYLKNWVIVLDPGHGGDAHIAGYKRGPSGVREAEMNLRVSILLKKLLDDAGALVTLTRDADYDLGLRERAEIANNIVRPDGGRGADLFISVHHNAVNRPEANYTSIWYHGPSDYAEIELDIAKPIAFHLIRMMRTDVPKTQPLMSDKQMYAGGFGVLKHATVPAILLECSFYTNPEEEQRLRDAVYNLREAYAVYWALCEYARGGRPTQKTPAVESVADETMLSTTLDDGLFGGWGAELGRIIPSSINVRVNGKTVPHTFDEKSRALKAVPGTLPDGAIVEVRFTNIYKHANHPQRYQVIRSEEGAMLTPIGRARPQTPTTGPMHPEAPVGTTRPAGTRELLQGSGTN